MGSSQSSTSKQTQTVTNNIIQESSQTCSNTVSNTITNTDIIIKNSTTGNIDLNQTASISDIGCVMKSTLDTNVSNILDSMTQQTSTAPSGLAFSWNNISENSNIAQLIENSITQIQTSACNTTATNDITDTFIYVENSTTGNIGLSQNASISNSQCNIENLATAVVANDATASTTQKSTITSMGTMIIIAIIICAIIAAVVMIMTSPSKPSQQAPSSSQYGNYNGGGDPAQQAINWAMSHPAEAARLAEMTAL